MEITGDDERAVSVAITHALTVAITTVLVSGLLVASGGLLESQEQNVGEDQLNEIGGDALTYIHSFDRMNQKGTNVETSATPDYPARVVGSYQYELELRDDGSHGTLVVRSSRLGRSAEFTIQTETAIENSTVRGYDVQISLCQHGSDGTITLGGCN